MKKNYLFALALIIIALGSCKKKDRSVSFTNNQYLTESYLLYGSKVVNWSVHVVANGTDFGIIEPGATSKIMTVHGSKLEVTTFAPVEDCLGKSISFKDGITRICVRNDEALAKKFVKTYSIPLNKDNYVVDVGVGSSDYSK